MRVFLSIIVGLALFAAGHSYATSTRGYDAIGGEVFALMIPAAVIVSEKARKGWWQ